MFEEPHEERMKRPPNLQTLHHASKPQIVRKACEAQSKPVQSPMEGGMTGGLSVPKP